MQSSRIQSKITFTTDREFQEYCESHDMRPDTEWEISSTGQRGRGPAESPASGSEDGEGQPEATFDLSDYGKMFEAVGYIEKTAKILFEER